MPETPTQPPLDDEQLNLVRALLDAEVRLVVTGPVAVRLHANAVGMQPSEMFLPPGPSSPRGYPGLDIAIEPSTVNRAVVARVLRDLTASGDIRTATITLATGATGNVPVTASGSSFNIAADPDGLQSYLRNPPQSGTITVDGVQIPVPDLLTVAATVHAQIAAGMQSGTIGPQGSLMLHELQDIVQRIGLAAAQQPPHGRRTAPGTPSGGARPVRPNGPEDGHRGSGRRGGMT